MAKRIADEVNEGESGYIEFQLVDANDTGVPDTNISTSVMTLWNRDTEAVINSLLAVDVSSKFDGSGNFSYLLVPADNVIVNADVNPHEIHIATITTVFTQGSDTLTHKENVEIKVLNNLDAPTS
jgi:hypothetical protein